VIFHLEINLLSVEDLKDMKTKLDRLHKKRDVKLGKGGIREIEFFIQAHQLINGGEIKEIRERNTVRAIEKLLKRRIINKRLGDILTNSSIWASAPSCVISATRPRTITC